MDRIKTIERQIIACERCKRLRAYCARIAATKRRAYLGETYWGKPVPSFGDPNARLLIVGLAPGAHGGNRTGRIFTGDSSGTFLFGALYRAGFSNLPDSVKRDDGLKLTDAYITAVIHCAPPENKPVPAETANCQEYLMREIRLLTRVKAVLVLGGIALAGYLAALKNSGCFKGKPSNLPFGHAKSYDLGSTLPRLFCSYHPSRQNTQTGRLTAAMLDQVFRDIRKFLSSVH